MSQPFSPLAIFRAIMLITGSTYFTYVTGLAVSVLIARHLGPDDYGRYAYLVWLAGVFVLTANNGLPVTGIRFVSEALGREAAAQAGAVHGWLWKWQLAAFTLAAIFLVLFTQHLLPSGWPYGVWVFAFLVLLAGVGKTTYLFQLSIAKGHGQFQIEAWSVVGVSLINVIAVAILYLLDATLIHYCVLFAVISLAYLVWSGILLRRGGIRSNAMAIDPEVMARLKPHLGWSVLYVLAFAFSNKTVETYVLNQYVTIAQVGFFVIAVTLTRSGVDLFVTGMNSVLMPIMAHGFGQGGKARVDAMVSDGLRMYQLAGLIVAGVGYFWAEPLVLLVYGEAYRPAAFAFQIMVLVAGLGLTEAVVASLLSTTDQQRIRVLFALMALVISVIAALLLIPRFGLIGAVLSHAISHMVVVAAGLLVANHLSVRALPWRSLIQLILLAMIAATASATGAWLVGGLAGQFVAGVLYVPCLLILLRLFGFWQASDAQMARTLTDRIPARADWIRRLLLRYFQSANRQ